MRRFHVHVSVEDLKTSISFYTALFGSEPTVQRADYAKWMLDDPHVNFAISAKSDRLPGLNHLGIQASDAAELEALHAALGAANIATVDEGCARCCYAEADKHWTTDPTGLVWETYHTMREIAVYGEDRGAGVDSLARPAAPEASATDPARA